jgi:hypothetical protein
MSEGPEGLQMWRISMNILNKHRLQPKISGRTDYGKGSLITSCRYKRNVTKLKSGGYVEDLDINGCKVLRKINFSQSTP